MRINELSRKMEEPDFWDNPDKAGYQTRELNALKSTKQSFYDLQNLYEDARTLLEMGYEEQDESLISEVKEAVDAFLGAYEELRITTLLSGEYDRDDAILTLHAGAGGTESCDWASMLYRMYTRWAEAKTVFTGLCGYHRLMRQESARPRLFPVMLCRILMRI